MHPETACGSYTWSLNAGSLPAGLSLSSAGVLSGTPTATGDSLFTVLVTDNASQTADLPLYLEVSPLAGVGIAHPFVQVYPSANSTTNNGTVASAAHIAAGSVTLASSGGSVTVTFSGAANFTSATSYYCTANDATRSSAVRLAQTATSITLTLDSGESGDLIHYICVGN